MFAASKAVAYTSLTETNKNAYSVLMCLKHGNRSLLQALIFYKETYIWVIFTGAITPSTCVHINEAIPYFIAMFSYHKSDLILLDIHSFSTDEVSTHPIHHDSEYNCCMSCESQMLHYTGSDVVWASGDNPLLLIVHDHHIQICLSGCFKDQDLA